MLNLLEVAFRPGDLPLAVDAVLAASTPPAGVFGAGAVVEDGRLRPAIFVMRELLRAAGVVGIDSVEPPQAPSLDTFVRSFAPEFPPDTVLVGLETPVEFVTPGNPLVCLGSRGTCGVAATAAGEKAILTAGHTARPVNVTVDDNEGRIGRVAWTDYLSNHGPGEDCADAAVVVLRSGEAVEGGPGIARAGTAGQLARVTAYGQRGPCSAWLRSPVIPSFALRTNEGSWKDVVITSEALSIPGDSGAPVLVDDDSGTVVGLVVGGAASYSVIQDITCILNETKTVLVTTA